MNVLCCSLVGMQLEKYEFIVRVRIKIIWLKELMGTIKSLPVIRGTARLK